jgi:hypothetical protein
MFNRGGGQQQQQQQQQDEQQEAQIDDALDLDQSIDESVEPEAEIDDAVDADINESEAEIDSAVDSEPVAEYDGFMDHFGKIGEMFGHVSNFMNMFNGGSSSQGQDQQVAEIDDALDLDESEAQVDEAVEAEAEIDSAGEVDESSAAEYDGFFDHFSKISDMFGHVSNIGQSIHGMFNRGGGQQQQQQDDQQEAQIDDALDLDQSEATVDEAVESEAEFDFVADSSVNNFGVEASVAASGSPSSSDNNNLSGESKSEKHIIVIVASAVCGFVFLTIVAVCILSRRRKNRLHISNIDPSNLNNQQALNTLTHEEIDAHVV